MGFDQHVNKQAAKRLNALEKQLASQEKIRDAASAKYDALYLQVWHIFDEELGEGTPARFVCANGYVLGRQVRKPAPTVSTDRLIALVGRLLPGVKGKRLLSRVLVMVPQVDQAKLAREVELGRLSAAEVQQCVTQKPPVLARYPHKEAKAQERLNLRYGIIESPEGEEENWAS